MFRKKLLIVAALALLFCSQAPAQGQADRWELITTSDASEQCYLDTRSVLEPAPGVYVAWFKLVPKDAPEKEKVERIRIWCGQRQFQLLTPKPGAVYDIRPDTVVESLMERLCAKG